MKFVDQAFITVKSGDGGAGACSFRREKYVPRGGPDGGNGGRGGHVIFVGDQNLTTLLDFKFKRDHFARSGSSGRGQKRYGKNGTDLFLRVPVGTLVKNSETDETLVDIVRDGQEEVIARGGKGGAGNFSFRSSTHQTPYERRDGCSGERFSLCLELKILSDVGLVGSPNAGKSTLISVLSSKKSKVAHYAFTTRTPILGVMEGFSHDSCVIADLPGLIKDAHLGVGLGHQFLRHVDRCRVLVFVIDVSLQTEDLLDNYNMLCREIDLYSGSLKKVPRICVLNKIDLDHDRDRVQRFFDAVEAQTLLISGLTGEGCLDLKKTIFSLLNALRKESVS